MVQQGIFVSEQTILSGLKLHNTRNCFDVLEVKIWLWLAGICSSFSHLFPISSHTFTNMCLFVKPQNVVWCSRMLGPLQNVV